MNDEKPFHLAVLKGSAKGTVLRTDRKRISVGGAADNDLVLSDPGIAPRHFIILIDQERWRVHTFSPEEKIIVDRRWAHPESGERGALLYAAGVELLLFHGLLSDTIIASETKLREATEPSTATATQSPASRPRQESATEIAPAIGSERDSTPEHPTIALSVKDVQKSLPRPVPLELVELSQVPTIAGERLPDDIRQAARVRLIDDRSIIASAMVRDAKPSAPMSSEEKTLAIPAFKKPESAWDKAANKRPRSSEAKPLDPIPEVVAEPESQLHAAAGGRSDPSNPLPRVGERARRDDPPSPKSKPASSPTNRPISGNRSIAAGTNAWGDPADRRSIATPAVEPKNAWGDAKDRGGPTGQDRNQRQLVRREVAPAILGAGASTTLSVQDIVKRGRNPAVSILHEPDGDFSTSIRLLGTRVEEFMRTLGYRAYMITSPEPLAGKTVSALNLAFALAEDTHRRVALVEANFRYPRLSEVLGLPERQGLIPILEGRLELSEAVVKINDRNLVMLPSGGRHPHPAELLASPRFKALIAELAHTVDVALIDAPSVVPSADANLILPLVDAVFLVVAEGATRSGGFAQAIAQLGQSRVLGAIYNQLPPDLLKQLRSERRDRMRKGPASKG